MTFILGLTGSIGMGKTTTAAMFADEGIAVWDADSAVHRLYAKGGAAVDLIAVQYPSAIIDGAVSRPTLKKLISQDHAVLKAIEQIVHPLVQDDRNAFLSQHDGELVVLDIPLLFETNAQHWMNAVAVCSTLSRVQRTRVLARPGMTPYSFEMILAKQMPDAEKRARADYVIETVSLDATRATVRKIIAEIREKMANA